MTILSRHARAVAVAVSLAATATLLACGGSAQAEGSRPPGWQEIHMPDSMPNVYTFCDHGNRVYLYRTGVGVAGQDPTCVEGAR